MLVAALSMRKASDLRVVRSQWAQRNMQISLNHLKKKEKLQLQSNSMIHQSVAETKKNIKKETKGFSSTLYSSHFYGLEESFGPRDERYFIVFSSAFQMSDLQLLCFILPLVHVSYVVLTFS